MRPALARSELAADMISANYGSPSKKDSCFIFVLRLRTSPATGTCYCPVFILKERRVLAVVMNTSLVFSLTVIAVAFPSFSE